MTDSIEDIRERKLAELRERAADGDADDGTGGAGADASTPTEPVAIEGTDHLEELAADSDRLFVEFHADWCGPCQMLAPELETVAAETDATVAKVDIDAHQEIASAYGIRGVPTTLLFAGGEPVERLVGVHDAATFTDLLAPRD